MCACWRGQKRLRPIPLIEQKPLVIQAVIEIHAAILDGYLPQAKIGLHLVRLGLPVIDTERDVKQVRLFRCPRIFLRQPDLRAGRSDTASFRA